MWKYHHHEGLDVAVCQRALSVITHLIDTVSASSELQNEAFLLARSARKPAYNMFYLALARREDAMLLTVDASLRREAQKQVLSVL
jgi:predicted nucleic acid-binding protein